MGTGVSGTLANLGLTDRPFLPDAIEGVQVLGFLEKSTDVVPGLQVSRRDGGEDVENWGGGILRFLVVNGFNRERLRHAREGARDKVGNIVGGEIGREVGVAEDYRREFIIDCIHVPVVEDYHLDPVCVCCDEAFQGEEEDGESGVEGE